MAIMPPERRKLATLLFCDVTGSTEMGERLDPETVRELMLRYFQVMRGAIERHGGTVEKFAGDANVSRCTDGLVTTSPVLTPMRIPSRAPYVCSSVGLSFSRRSRISDAARTARRASSS
jgi:class 3 adenylate cyclase